LKRVFFVTTNGWRHQEAKQLLSGLRVERSRLKLDKGAKKELGAIATARVRDAFRQLKAACFVENTGMFLESSAEGAEYPGTRFKRALRELGEAGFAKRYGGVRGETRVVVAYTVDGEAVQLFEGTSAGCIASSPQGAGGYGWDRLWIPDGFTRTLAELRGSKFVVNMRLFPFLELGAVLRAETFDGVFESHVTVAPCDEAAFAKTCDALGVKAIFIQLPQGENPRQPMSGAHHRGALSEVLREVHQLARDIAAAGFEVVRTKVEAVGRRHKLPLTDAAALSAPRSNYFEHHAKLRLPEGADETAITRALAERGAYLSQSARSESRQRFVTLRSWGLGERSADARFEAVVELAERLAVPLRSRAREYTVYDSSLELDSGWMA
jgi:inosine/xanthosine triphosphate pyrophosphatase family protein